MQESARITLSIIIMYLALLFSSSAMAETSRFDTWIDSMIEYNKYLSGKIRDSAHQIDMFLSRRKYTDDPNESNIVLKSFASHLEGGEKSSSVNFDVNLRLPNLEERWAVRFSSYDVNREDRGIRNQQQRTRPRELNYGAGLLLLQELGNIKTTFQPRVQLKDPLETSYTLRFESSGDIRAFSIDPKLELFADSERGTGQFLSLNMQLSTQRDISILQFNEEQYENAEKLFTTLHGISISRNIGERKGVSSTLSFASSSRPAFHLRDFTWSAAFAAEPYRRVFAYSVGPIWVFAKDENFKGKIGASMDVQFIF